MTEAAQVERPPIVAAIITHNGEVLLVRRRLPEGDLMWQFPAGELEPGETPEAGAARETREEVGLTVTPTKVIGERSHPATGRRMVYVACDVSAGAARVVDTEELSDIAWTSPDSLEDYVRAGVFPPVLTHLRSLA